MELLTSIALLGFFFLVAGAAFVVLTRSNAENEERLVAIQGARRAAVYFVPDAQSTDGVPDTGSTALCDPEAGEAHLMSFSWSEGAAQDEEDEPYTEQAVEYEASWVVDDAGRLVRRLCRSVDGSAKETLERNVVVPDLVLEPPLLKPSLECVSASGSMTSDMASCAVPERFVLEATSGTAEDEQPLTFRVSATKRTSP